MSVSSSKDEGFAAFYAIMQDCASSGNMDLTSADPKGLGEFKQVSLRA
jgi:hypothetical protein